MAAYHFTKEEIINKTRLALHSYFNRSMDALLALMDEDCIWIGSYDSQYLHGKAAFLAETKTERQEPPVQMMQEEYALLFQNGRYSAVYGRFTVTAETADNTILMAKVRLTFIFQQKKDQLSAILIHCSDSRDVPLQYEKEPLETLSKEMGFFEYIRHLDTQAHQAKRILIKDVYGCIRTLFPADIFYIKSNNKECTVYTGSGDFLTHLPLRELAELCPQLLRLHRSYLVNPVYIKGIYRYKATLADGSELPISKERYMSIKKLLLSAKSE